MSSVLSIFFFLFLFIIHSSALIPLGECPEYCGYVEIPYPFGVGEACSLDNRYAVDCKTVSESENGVPFLGVSNIEVVKISLPSGVDNDGSISHGSLLIKTPINSTNLEEFRSLFNFAGMRNSKMFQAKEYVLLEYEWSFPTKNLSSLRCKSIKEYGTSHDISCICQNRTESGIVNANCVCNRGYRGNPYIWNDGCQDINECKEYKDGHHMYCKGMDCENAIGSYRCRDDFSIGDLTLYGILLFIVGPCLLVVVVVAAVVYIIFIRRYIRIKRRSNFFKRNGGLLLQQQIDSTGGSDNTTKLFTAKELSKATGKFSENRLLGQGGQGTVYKGMLIDGRTVAVKKSTKVDEDKLQEFINEVVILSQISHRSIVKLIGFCLETEVPLLVYEFISNGNLFEHIQKELADETMCCWDERLRIAIEIAEALSYLHFTASIPIFHKDVKTTNIMLDDKFRAKVSDFGSSRSIPEDHTHVTTIVSGTAGYLDPEYFQSSQYSDKSDVFSFGVVLAELITGEKPVSLERPTEIRALATYFNRTIKENRLVEIIDARIRDESKLGQVMAVAKVARKCLNMKRRKRPDMKQVLTELEMCRSSPEQLQPHEYESDNEEEEEEALEVLIGVELMNNVAATAPAHASSSSMSWSDVEPLFPRTR